MLIRRKSQLSGKTNEMDLPVTQEQLDTWQRSGELIQRAFPNLSPDQREFLLTGATQAEWDKTFPPEDED